MRCDTSPERKSTGLSPRAHLNLSYVVSQGRNSELSHKNRGLEGSELLHLETFQRRLGLSGNSYSE